MNRRRNRRGWSPDPSPDFMLVMVLLVLIWFACLVFVG